MARIVFITLLFLSREIAAVEAEQTGSEVGLLVQRLLGLIQCKAGVHDGHSGWSGL